MFLSAGKFQEKKIFYASSGEKKTLKQHVLNIIR